MKRKIKLTKADRAYFAEKGAEGGKIGNREGKSGGGKARMAQLTDEERSALASKAGKASAKARARKEK